MLTGRCLSRGQLKRLHLKPPFSSGAEPAKKGEKIQLVAGKSLAVRENGIECVYGERTAQSASETSRLVSQRHKLMKPIRSQ